ncbi:MAG: AraC family transcriptional regulator [Flavobacterium psychrophilum]|nr:MAG: AraC family transcriptional regulator [Flavobacterium psychrophilum]
MELLNSNELPDDFSQNSILPLRIVTPDFGHLTEQAAKKYGQYQRLPYYFFLFVLEGATQHGIDTENFSVGRHEMLFSTPGQIREFPETMHGKNYYKLGFNHECLARLPKVYPFLINPLNQQKISFLPDAALRLEEIFNILLNLLQTPDGDQELILAYLHSLLTEINAAYFTSGKKPSNERLEKFIGFKIFVENNLVNHPTVVKIAEELAISTDSLYQIVKQYSGLSPKEFITKRLILEARRRIYYNQHTTVKELAYELGFNDPDYFSRLFRKTTGKTIAAFFKDLS